MEDTSDKSAKYLKISKLYAQIETEKDPVKKSITVQQVLTEIIDHSPITHEAILKELSKKSNITIETLKKELNKLIRERKKEEELQSQPDRGFANTILMLLASKQFSEATEIIVENILNKEKIYTTRTDVNAEMWIYKEGIYVPQAKTYIHEHIRKMLGQAYSAFITNNVIDKIQSDTYIEQDEFFEEEHKNLVPVLNGILDLKTREIQPFNVKYKFFNKLPIRYVPGLDCPMIKKFFTSVFEHNKEINVIQELFGYLLLRENTYEKAFMLLGDGRNGKGKTLMLMKLFVGVENCAEVPLNELERDMYVVGELFKKMANLCGDLSKTALKETGDFKKLVGRDLISSARKYKTRVHFYNYAKMIFSCNDLPTTYDLTEAFFDRWIILNYPYKFIPEKDLSSMTKTELKWVKKQDPEIIEHIVNENELSGLLNWALEGLQRLRKKDVFSYSPSTNDVKSEWLRKCNSCHAFVSDCMRVQWDGVISKNEFRQYYALYCRVYKLKVGGDKNIKHVLSTHFGVGEEREMYGGDKVSFWTNIVILDEAKKALHEKLNKDTLEHTNIDKSIFSGQARQGKPKFPIGSLTCALYFIQNLLLPVQPVKEYTVIATTILNTDTKDLNFQYLSEKSPEPIPTEIIDLSSPVSELIDSSASSSKKWEEVKTNLSPKKENNKENENTPSNEKGGIDYSPKKENSQVRPNDHGGTRVSEMGVINYNPNKPDLSHDLTSGSHSTPPSEMLPGNTLNEPVTHLPCWLCGISPVTRTDDSATGKGRPICTNCKETLKQQQKRGEM